MPYCPKCDMEFVEGITVCSDCHGPLVPSKEEYLKSAASGRAVSAGKEAAASQNGALSPDAAQAAARAAASQRTASYVSSREKSEDLHSSSSAFFLVGGAALLAAVLGAAGILPLPMTGASRLLFLAVAAGIGILCLIVAVKSRSQASAAAAGAAAEESRTEELIGWFLASWDKTALDGRLLAEDPSLEGAELDLKRYELIQDCLITGRDLPDPAYVDYLAEQIYERLYPETDSERPNPETDSERPNPETDSERPEPGIGGGQKTSG